MKPFLYLTLFLTAPFTGLSQQQFTGEIQWGQQVKDADFKPVETYVVGNSFYQVVQPGKKPMLQKYDVQSLALQEEKVIDLIYNGKTFILVGQLVFADQMMFISYYWDTKTKTVTYLMHTLQDGHISNPVKLTQLQSSRLPDGNIWTPKQYRQTGYFDYFISSDRQSLMIRFRDQIAGKASDAEKLKTILFDNQLREVRQGLMEKPITDKYATFRLSNEGELYILFLRDFFIYNGSSMEKLDISFPGYMLSCSFDFSSQGSLLIFGAYANAESRNLDGMFLMKFRPDMSLEFTVKETFDAVFKQTANSEVKLAGFALPAYKMHDILLKDNGDMTLFVEKWTYYSEPRSQYSDVKNSFIYGNITVLNCSSTGQVFWKGVIPKEETTYNSANDYSSCSAFRAQNNIYVVYNKFTDYHQGENLKEKKELKGTCVSMITSIDEHGNILTQQLDSSKGDEVRVVVPKFCRPVSDGQFLLYSVYPIVETKGWALISF